MKRLLVLVIALFASPAAPAKEAAAILLVAPRFSIGPVGEAGTSSDAELALRALVKRPDAVSECRKLLEKATPAEQLYGLFGLRLVDEAAFKKELPRFKGSKTEVLSQLGCFPLPTTVGDQAGKIGDGTYK